MTAVPDLLATTSLSRNINKVKSDADVARTEAVTGRIENLKEAVNGDIGSVHLLRKAINDVQGYQSTLTQAENRITRIQSVLGNIGADTSRIATGIFSALGQEDEFAVNTLTNESRIALASAFSGLNTSFEGRSVFGGDVTNQPPLASVETLIADVQAILTAGPDAATINAALDTYFNDPAGGYATNIYQGGVNNAPGIEISPGIRLDVSVRADEQPIKDLLRGLAVLASKDAIVAGGETERRQVLQDAAALSVTANTNIIAEQAVIGASEGQISRIKDRYDAEEIILTNLYNERTARDPYEAATQLQLLETQLESAYLMTARISRLSLSNYI